MSDIWDRGYLEHLRNGGAPFAPTFGATIADAVAGYQALCARAAALARTAERLLDALDEDALASEEPLRAAVKRWGEP